MAQITVTIPDAEMPRVVNALCSAFNYQDTVNGSPNPETKAQFARRMFIQMIKNAVRTGETRISTDSISIT